MKTCYLLTKQLCAEKYCYNIEHPIVSVEQNSFTESLAVLAIFCLEDEDAETFMDKSKRWLNCINYLPKQEVVHFGMCLVNPSEKTLSVQCYGMIRTHFSPI